MSLEGKKIEVKLEQCDEESNEDGVKEKREIKGKKKEAY